MKYVYTEMLVLTKEDTAILNSAVNLLENIYKEAMVDGDIEAMARVAMDNINELLSEDYSEMER